MTTVTTDIDVRDTYSDVGDEVLDDLEQPATAPRGDTTGERTGPEAPTPAPLKLARWEKGLAGLGVLLGTGVSTLGLWSSYESLEERAATPVEDGGWGWSEPWMLPIGLDLSILAFSIVDLLLIRFGRPARWVKWVPRAGTAATVYLNWSAAGSLPSQLGHAALACLWVVFAEIAAHLYASHIGAREGRQQAEPIPRSRWLLSPVTTARMARRMRLRGMTYDEVLLQDRDLRIYRERLRQKYAQDERRWSRAATPDEMLPFKLAPAGFTVEQSLAVPLLEEVREQERQSRAALRRAQAAVQQVAADLQIREAEIQAQVDRIRLDGRLRLAEQEAKAEIDADIQRRQAEVQRQAAEVQAETRRIQDEAEAHSRRLADEAERRAAQARREEEKAAAEAELERLELLARKDELTRKREESAAQAASDAARREQEEQLHLEATRKTLEAKTEAERKAAEVEANSKAEAAVAAAEVEKAAALLEKERLEEEAAQTAKRAAEHREREGERLRKAAEHEEAAQRAREEEAASRAREERLRRQAAEDAKKAAELEAAAVEAAARARMGQADWDAERVAALLMAPRSKPLTVKDIAAHLGCSVGTAQDRKERALALLAQRGESPVTAVAA